MTNPEAKGREAACEHVPVEIYKWHVAIVLGVIYHRMGHKDDAR